MLRSVRIAAGTIEVVRLQQVIVIVIGWPATARKMG